MSLTPRSNQTIPAETARIARAAFPKGNLCLRLRDELGPIYSDAQFAHLFAWRGQPGESPAQLALVSILQYAEGLSDRQAAEMVRGRIDWKYLLGLELSDSGFDYSVLSEFRARLVDGGEERLLLDTLLALLREQGLVQAGGRQRTDSTHVLAAVRQLNRIEFVTETVRRALDAVAAAAPDWLRGWVAVAWYERYSLRSQAYRLPTKPAEQAAWLQQVGEDGYALLQAIYESAQMGWLGNLEAVEHLRQIWTQQYYRDEAGTRLRQADVEGVPPHTQLIVSPDDLEARNRSKRETNWSGYVVHLTESCDADSPHLITHVETTAATVADATTLPTIHQALAEKELLPAEHLLDTAYVSADHLVVSQKKGVDLVGPVPADNSWQAHDPNAFDLHCFALDWDAQVATCPHGQQSQSWRHRHPGQAEAYVEITFPRQACRDCPVRQRCTRSQSGGRVLRLQPQARYLALQAARHRQETDNFKQTYRQRAGIEGAISQAVRVTDLRHAHYIGLAKTRLQHVLTAAAIDFKRLYAWFDQQPLAKTRVSHFAALARCT